MFKVHKTSVPAHGTCTSFFFGLAVAVLGLSFASTSGAQGQTWSWQTELIDSLGKFPAIIADRQGNIHVSYIHEGKGVMYAFRSAGAPKWYTMLIDAGGGPGNETTGIALDSAGNPQICFTPGPLKYSSFDGHEWKTESIGANTSLLEYSCSIAIASNGTPHVIWYQTHNADGSTFNHIRHAVKQDGVWLARTIDFDFETGKWNSLALDGTGSPRLSYSSLAGGELRFAALESNRWDISVIDSRNFKDNGSFNRGLGSSLILDKQGSPIISYYNDSLLKIARKREGRWINEIVDHTAPSNAWSAYRSTLMVDGQGLLHICYEDSGAIKHAVWDGTSWRVQLVTVGGNQPRWPSMAIDASGTVYIVYRDPVDNSLKVAVGHSGGSDPKAVAAGKENF
jgi:hypothetical protein